MTDQYTTPLTRAEELRLVAMCLCSLLPATFPTEESAIWLYRKTEDGDSLEFEVHYEAMWQQHFDQTDKEAEIMSEALKDKLLEEQ